MKTVIKTYCIRERAIFSNGIKAYLLTPSFSNRENHKRARIICNSILYAVPTTERIFTPEASRNRKYQIEQ